MVTFINMFSSPKFWISIKSHQIEAAAKRRQITQNFSHMLTRNLRLSSHDLYDIPGSGKWDADNISRWSRIQKLQCTSLCCRCFSLWSGIAHRPQCCNDNPWNFRTPTLGKPAACGFCLIRVESRSFELVHICIDRARVWINLYHNCEHLPNKLTNESELIAHARVNQVTQVIKLMSFGYAGSYWHGAWGLR